MRQLIYFRETNGGAPFMGWFNDLPDKAKKQCRSRLQLLTAQGHLLRRPAADYLQEGIYELRIKAERIHYRILYFFYGNTAVVVSHGIIKQQAIVPHIEIDRARQRKIVFTRNPTQHAYILKAPL